MRDMLVRIFWFAIVASMLAYGVYLIAGSVVNAQASGTNDPIIIRDVLSPGTHNLSGMVMVPTPCDELAVATEALSSSTYMLAFSTWREPSVPDCPDDATPRDFRAVMFAPAAGVQFGATMNGAGLPIIVLPIVPDKNND